METWGSYFLLTYLTATPFQTADDIFPIIVIHLTQLELLSRQHHTSEISSFIRTTYYSSQQQPTEAMDFVSPPLFVLVHPSPTVLQNNQYITTRTHKRTPNADRRYCHRLLPLANIYLALTIDNSNR